MPDYTTLLRDSVTPSADRLIGFSFKLMCRNFSRWDRSAYFCVVSAVRIR
jgi:hypothetical protein